MCDVQQPAIAGASTISIPFKRLQLLVLHVLQKLFYILGEYAGLLVGTFASGTMKPASAYTTTFKAPTGGRLPCQKESSFYVADTDHSKMMSISLLEGDSAERPCKQNAAQCAMYVPCSRLQ